MTKCGIFASFRAMLTFYEDAYEGMKHWSWCWCWSPLLKYTRNFQSYFFAHNLFRSAKCIWQLSHYHTPLMNSQFYQQGDRWHPHRHHRQTRFTLARRRNWKASTWVATRLKKRASSMRSSRSCSQRWPTPRTMMHCTRCWGTSFRATRDGGRRRWNVAALSWRRSKTNYDRITCRRRQPSLIRWD